MNTLYQWFAVAVLAGVLIATLIGCDMPECQVREHSSDRVEREIWVPAPITLDIQEPGRYEIEFFKGREPGTVEYKTTKIITLYTDDV